MAQSPDRSQISSLLPDLTNPENRAATLLFVYNFLIMSAFSAIKPIRSALLLARLGPGWLPIAFIGTAVSAAVVVYAAGWFADRVPSRFRVFATTVFLILNLLLFRWLFEAAGSGVALAFYIWAQLFSNILITQFWLVAGGLFTPREAKRLFSWVGAGGIIGAIAGPVVAYRAIGWIGTENIIYIPCVLLCVCLPLIQRLEGRSQDPARSEPSESVASKLGLFREFRHLKLIALISGVSFVVQAILDYQFQTITAHWFATEDLKAAFFAKFFAVQNLAGLVFQLLLTRFLLLRFGVGVALLLLPAALCTGAVGILLYPTLWVTAAAKLGEGGLRYSLQEATREILYLPLPQMVRSRARPVIDMFGARLFEGSAGLLILGCTSLLHMRAESLSWISIGLILIWAIAIFGVKREYLQSLRNLFSDVPAVPQNRAAEVLDMETVALLEENLDNDDELQVCQALDMLDLLHEKASVLPQIKRTMDHPSPAVRSRALGMMRRAGASGYEPHAESLLSDPHPGNRLEAVRYLCRFGDVASRSKLSGFLGDEDTRIRTAAIALVDDSGPAERRAVRQSLDVLWEGDAGSDDARCEAALVLGTINHPEFDDLLVHLLNDPSPSVVRGALEAVEQTQRRVFVPQVTGLLGDERLNLYACRALRAYGDRILGSLRDHLDDPDEPDMVRRAVPACFAAIGSQRAAEALTDALSDHQNAYGDAIVEALDEIRNRRTDVVFDIRQVEAALLREVGGRAKPAEETDSDHRMRRIIGLLALIYPSEDIYRAYAGIRRGQREQRANAIELLDNLLRPETKRAVLPYFESCTSLTGTGG